MPTALRQSITEFGRLVSAISQQSRFLALHASVEAARAGDVGRGFAVAADEAKELAGRTAQAAQDIDAQIKAVQHETRQAVEGVQRISGTLGSIAQAQDTIAAAVEQQRAAIDRVMENVDRAANGGARLGESRTARRTRCWRRSSPARPTPVPPPSPSARTSPPTPACTTDRT